MESNLYPETFYRGISKSHFIDCYQHPTLEAFVFDDIREDGFSEMSISWNDSEEALNVLLSQKKEGGSLQFEGGAVELPFPKLKQITLAYINLGQFSYERKATDDNIFHGNLLIKQNFPEKTTNKQFSAIIRNLLVALASLSPIYKKN